MLEKCLCWEICFTQLDEPRRQFVAIFAAVNILHLFTLFQLERMKMFELCEFTVDTNVDGCCAYECSLGLHTKGVQYTRVSQRNMHGHLTGASRLASCMHDVMEAKYYYSACAIDSSTRNILDKIISAFYTGRPTHKWSPKLVEERKKKKSWSTAIRSYHLILVQIVTLNILVTQIKLFLLHPVYKMK